MMAPEKDSKSIWAVKGFKKMVIKLPPIKQGGFFILGGTHLGVYYFDGGIEC